MWGVVGIVVDMVRVNVIVGCRCWCSSRLIWFSVGVVVGAVCRCSSRSLSWCSSRS